MRPVPPALLRLARCALPLALALAFAAPAQDALELRVKSAFLYNFAKFVSWPSGKLAGSTDPIRFCVFERDALGVVLEATLSGKSIDSHPLQLRRVSRPEQLRDCEIAYLGPADAGRAAAALSQLAGSGVLSVYDADAPQRGGVVRFYLDERKVHFEINETAAEQEGLQVSSRLLGVASVVRE